MSAPKSRCPDCRELKGECVCEDEPVNRPIDIALMPRLTIEEPGPTGVIRVAGVPIVVVVDETLPPGTLEMRSPGHAPVRMVNIAPDVAT